MVPGFLADPDPDFKNPDPGSGIRKKNTDPDPDQRTRIRNTGVENANLFKSSLVLKGAFCYLVAGVGIH